MADKPLKSNTSNLSKEERLAENLRANLRRRKQALRKTKINSYLLLLISLDFFVPLLDRLRAFLEILVQRHVLAEPPSLIVEGWFQTHGIYNQNPMLLESLIQFFLVLRKISYVKYYNILIVNIYKIKNNNKYTYCVENGDLELYWHIMKQKPHHRPTIL